MTKSYLAQPSVYRLPNVIEMIEDGRILIARFQRPFVWKDEQRLNLLDSIMKGMPIGSLLIWQTYEHQLATYKKLGPYKLREPERGQRHYLLDGHQRLSTLFGALKRPPETVEEGDEEDLTNWPIYADLEGDEVVFKLRPRNRTPPLTWLPAWKLLSPLELYEHQKQLLDKKMKVCARRAEELANQFKDYQIPVIPLVTEDLAQVTESFQRVNSQGTPMSEIHMVNALMWTRDFDLNKRMAEVADQLKDVGWGQVDAQFLLDVIKVNKGIDVYRGNPGVIKQAISSDPKALDALVQHVKIAARFLAEYCGVRGPGVLPYKYQGVLLAEAAAHSRKGLQGDLAERLRRWFWRTTYGEFFTGMNSSQIRRAAEHVRALVAGKKDEESEWPDGLQREVKPARRFDFNSVRGRAYVLLLASQAPLGPDGRPIKADELVAEAGSDVVVKVLSSKLLSNKKESRLYEGPANRWIMSIGHGGELLALLGEQSKSKKVQTILKSHAIPPKAAEALRQQDYKDFLLLRRQYIQDLERKFVSQYGLQYVLNDEDND